MKRNNCLSVFFVILLSLLILTACKDEDDLYATRPDKLEGYFSFTHATFEEMIDLDGDGVRMPTDDALQCLYDIVNIYEGCPSEEISIFKFQDLNKKFYHYCDFTGKNILIGDYRYITSASEDVIDLIPEIFNDPGDLYNDDYNIRLTIEQVSKVDGAWIFQGKGKLLINAYPEALTSFNYELQQVFIE